MEENYDFVIPEMPSKTFGMLYKKLPDHLSQCEYIKIVAKLSIYCNNLVFITKPRTEDGVGMNVY